MTAPAPGERLFVLLGHPVAHSLSPAMHRAAFEAAHLPARYVALDVRDFAAAWSAVRRLEIAGGNVTVPWKEEAARALDRPSELVRRTRSANTFWRTTEGLLAGEATDGGGFLAAVREAFGLDARGLRVAVLGAGGGGRAVLHALAAAGAAALHVWNRTPARAAELVEDLRRSGFAGELAILPAGAAAAAGDRESGAAPPRGRSGGRLSDIGGMEAHWTGAVGGEPRLAPGTRVDLLVNATSLGLGRADPPPARPDAFPGVRFAMDLVYGARPTPFLQAFAAAGVRVTDGTGMLLHQGALAFELWFGVAAPLAAMRAALEDARGARG